MSTGMQRPDWDRQLYVEDVEVNQVIPPVSIPLTLQRMVMAAGSNRDFMPIHHSRKAAQEAGAKDIFVNTFFLHGLFVRMLRNWIGLRGEIRKISFQMRGFNCVGDVLTCSGRVTKVGKDDDRRQVELEIWIENSERVTAPGIGIVTLPSRGAD